VDLLEVRRRVLEATRVRNRPLAPWLEGKDEPTSLTVAEGGFTEHGHGA